jgi:hypothetical protein
MKFYNRTNEFAELQQIKNLPFTDYSRMKTLSLKRKFSNINIKTKTFLRQPRF